MSDSKFREWWIAEASNNYSEDTGCVVKSPKEITEAALPSFIHVIEKSANNLLARKLEVAMKGLTDLSNTIGFSEIMRIYAKDILRQIEQLGKEAK